MTTTEAPVQAQLDAYNARDIEAYLAVFAEDVKAYNFPGLECTINGLEEMRQAYQVVFDESPNLHCKLINRIVMDNKVFDHEHVTGRRGVDFLELVAIYEVENGKIQTVYFARKA